MTVNVKKMTVNVTFFLTLSMTKKDHCKQVYSGLNSFSVILMVAVTFTVVIFGQI